MIKEYFSEHFYLTVPFASAFIITILCFLFIPDLNQLESGPKVIMFTIIDLGITFIIGIFWEMFIFGPSDL